MDTINDRIAELIRIVTDNNKRRFAITIGVGTSVIENIVGERQSKPGFEFLEKLMSSIEDINANWLLTGKGEVFQKNDYRNDYRNDYPSTSNEEKSISESISKGQKNSNENGKVNGNPNTSNEEIQNLVAEAKVLYNKGSHVIDSTPIIYNAKSSENAVPVYDLPVSAGAMGLIAIGDEKQVVGYVDMPVFRGCERILPVMGVSMEPLIHSGDLIGIKSITNLSARWDFLQTGKIYLIITKDERMIKYINEASDQQYIVCSSPNFSPFKVHKADVLQLFRVAAIARGL